MGDRLLRIQDDFETMQRLMNELEYEKKQYEKEIEKELQLIAELECKTEAAKQEVKLNREAAKQHDDEAKLLNNQCVQDVHNYNSLQEACDILNEQEKSLSRHLKAVKATVQTAREKHKATVEHYQGIYKSYKEKYEKYPLAIERKKKEKELANWEKNYNEAKLKAQEAEQKLVWMETTALRKAAASTDEFPIFKNQKEFIIRLAEMKVTFDELVAEFNRKTRGCEELKKFIEEVKAKRQLEEKKREDEEKRIAEERRVSEERSIVEAEVRRQEEARRHSETQKKRIEERQMEESLRHSDEQKRWIEERQMAETRQRTQYQQIPLQVPRERDGLRPEMTTALQPAALPTSATFRQRLPPKIHMPTRQMLFQQKGHDLGGFRPPLPPDELQHPLRSTGTQLEPPVLIKTLVPCSGVAMTTTPRRQQPHPYAFDATTTSIPSAQPLCFDTPVAIAIPVPPKQLPYVDTPVATAIRLPLKQVPYIGTPVAATTPIPQKRPLYIGTPIAATTPIPPRQPLHVETPVAATTPVQEKQPFCREAAVRFTELPTQYPCHEAAGAITTCLQNLSIFGQSDRNILMETEDETLPTGFHLLEPSSATQSGFYQQSGGVTTEPEENLMLPSVRIQEAEQETRKESYVDTETPMSTDQLDQEDASVEVMASAAGLANPETSLNLSQIQSNSEPLQTSKTFDSYCDSVMLDGHSSDKSRSNADFVASSSLTPSVCFPSDISLSSDLSDNLVSEASFSTASHDCSTLTVTSSYNYPGTMTMTPSAVNLSCPTSEEVAATLQVNDANSVASAAGLECTTTTIATSEPEFCTAESVASDFMASLEQPTGWAICGPKSPTVPAAEAVETGSFTGSSSPVVAFSFEEEMAKLKKLSESPGINLYAGRRMFNQEIVDKSVPLNEAGGTSGFPCEFGQYESTRGMKGSEKATLPDFIFGNLFTFSNRSESDETFSFLGSRGSETENSSHRDKAAAASSDDIFKMFGGSDAENASCRKKEARSDGSGDIFKMLGISGNTSANSSKKSSDDAGEFFNFGVKSINDGPVKSQFKFF